MLPELDAILELIALVYCAAGDEAYWPIVSRSICDFLQCSGMAILATVSKASAREVACVSYGMRQEQLDECKARLFGTGTSLRFGLDCRGGQNVFTNLCLHDSTAGAGTDGSGAEQGYHLVARLEVSPGVSSYADLYRTAGSPAFDADSIEAFWRIVPHLERSMALSRDSANLRARQRAMLNAVDRMPFVCILLNRDGAVMEMNDAARAVMDANDGLTIEREYLEARRESDTRTLRKLIQSALSDDPEHQSGSCMLRRSSVRRPYVVFVDALPRPAAMVATDVPSAVVTVLDPEKTHRVASEDLRELFELTKTESLIARYLADGDSIEQAAKGLGMSATTARLHVEHIFRKTGAHRQAELVNMLLSPFICPLHREGRGRKR